MQERPQTCGTDKQPIHFFMEIKTNGLLPKKYFLDKNFMPLCDQIYKKLVKKDYGDAMEKVIRSDFKDVIVDVLLELKPTYEQVKRKK